jgi:purine nucleosidase
VDVLTETVRSRPGEITLVTLGPLTNLAVAVLREPELPHLLRRLVMMAGAYRSPGNTAPTSEWNVAVDPEAMKVVLTAFGTADPTGPAGSKAGATPNRATSPRPFALGLDVTERAKFTPDHLARLAEAAGEHDPERASNPVVRFVADALRFYMEFHSRFDGFYGAFIHDALALAFTLDPSLGRTESLAVDVELGGNLTTGETVTDWRRRWGRPPNLEIVVTVDHERFLDRFIDRIGGLARQAAEGGRQKDLAAGQPRVAS